MSSSFTMTLLLVGLASAQTVSDTIGFGSFQSGGPNFSAFVDASLNPMYHYSFGFTGYNLSNITGNGGTIAQTNSSENWSLNMNYSIVQTNQQTVSNLVYSLTFPEEELPITNASDWQLCAHVAEISFPSNVSNADWSNDGSCLPFFGRDCYDAVLQSMSTSSVYGTTNCPAGPLFANIPACRAHFGFMNATIATSGVMNHTDPYLVYNYNNHSYVDSRTGQVVANPTFTGLRSGNPYAYKITVLANNNSDTIRAQATKLIFSGLSLTESPSYRARTSGQGGTAFQGNNPRLICGRAVKTSGNTSGATVVKGSSFAATVLALAISSFMYL